MKKRLLSVAVAGILLFSAFLGGCGTVKDSKDETVPSVNNESAEALSEAEEEAKEPIVGEVETLEEPTPIAGDETFLLYFSGIDVFGGPETKSRSDVNILAAVNRRTRKIQLVSTPRDYYVTIPGSGDARDKLTHAGLYGIDCSMGALENLYGVDIDYYIRVNFSGYEEVIDKLGGLDVFSQYDFTVEPIKHYTEGINHLSGIEALAFARERHAFKAGDVQRGINQMEVVKALVRKMTSDDVINNFDSVMENLSPHFQTDLPEELITDLAKQQRQDPTEWTVETYYVTGNGEKASTYSIPGSKVYVMMPIMEQVQKGAELLNETMSETGTEPAADGTGEGSAADGIDEASVTDGGTASES